METKITQLNKFKYAKYKFKYLCLKLQNGGYSDVTPQNLAAAAIAVINCSFVGTNQISVDCIDETKKSYEEVLKELEDERNNITNDATLSTVKKANKLRENQVKIDNHKTKKSSVTNVITQPKDKLCDPVLATVASVYLSLIYATRPNDFITLIRDLINAKVNNCKIRIVDNQRFEVKKKEIQEYYLKVLMQINKFLTEIGQTTTYEKIFTNSEFSKTDEEANLPTKTKNSQEKMTLENEKKTPNIAQPRLTQIKARLDQIDAENTKMRIANSFMLQNIGNVRLLNIENIKTELSMPTDFNNYVTIGQAINPDNFIIKGSYLYDKNTNTDIVSDKILFGQYRQK
jgi:hypothetical protein